jgi:RHS repeat-associated protein
VNGSAVSVGDRGYSYDGIGNRYRSSRNSTNPATASGGNLATYYSDSAGTTEGGNALNQYEKVGLYGASPAAQVYDADGNQTDGPFPNGSDGDRWWDGENRMIRSQIGSTDTYYAQDPFGRRVAKFQGGGSGMTGTVYFYDGWNVAAECSIASSTYPLARTYTWGPDLGGTFQGAGGVGGLLAVEIETGTNADVYYPTFDGNGNVMEYMNSTYGVIAHYEYDPFGEEAVASGALASLFNYRFSTKPLDSETGLYYFGYRYYDPVTGRWPSRDPIQESGGMNLYGFVNNAALDEVDFIGLQAAQYLADPTLMRCSPCDELRKKLNDAINEWEKTRRQLSQMHSDLFDQYTTPWVSGSVSDSDYAEAVYRWREGSKALALQNSKAAESIIEIEKKLVENWCIFELSDTRVNAIDADVNKDAEPAWKRFKEAANKANLKESEINRRTNDLGRKYAKERKAK